jgi:outer membrane protein assembly factor BamA
MIPLSIALVRETTVFREYGPLAGSTARISYEYAPPLGRKADGTATLLSRQTIDADARHYLRIGSNGVLATRIRGFRSTGDFPGFMYFGGNADLRGYDYYQFVGQNVIYANAELRFPIIEAALTPIGVVGGVRGVFFAGAGGAWFSNQQSQNPCNGEANGFKFVNSDTTVCQVVTGVKTDSLGQPVFNTDPKTGLQSPALTYSTQQISGFRLQDGRASYGLGLETFMLGFPIHFDWSWRTLFNKDWENVVFACTSTTATGQCVSGAADFRKPRFAVWIGYDF